MAVQNQIEPCGPIRFAAFWIMQYEDSSAGPFERSRRQDEIESEAPSVLGQASVTLDIVVAEDAKERRIQFRERLEHRGFRQVTGMNDAFDVGLVKEVDDSFDVVHSIVGVADDANSHPSMLSRRSRPLVAGYSAASCVESTQSRARPGEMVMVEKKEQAASSSLETMLATKADGVMTITLNRPERLNAFTLQMARDWFTVLDDADTDDDVRAIIVTGAGRGFCAGADLSGGGETFNPVHASKESTEGTEGTVKEPRDVGGMVTLRIYRCLKPLIAAVNGPAVGVGVTSILPMDIRLASESARFGFVFARRGVVMEACSSWFLPRVVGINRAMEWVATGRVFDADEALRGGLVSEVHPADALLDRARALAQEIAQNTSSVSVALCRQMMWQMLGADHPIEAHRLDSKAMNYMGSRADSREGVSSFLEKRPPNFSLGVSGDFPTEIGLRQEPPYEP